MYIDIYIYIKIILNYYDMALLTNKTVCNGYIMVLSHTGKLVKG